ncbi:MAG: hypothetical protein HUJ86_03560 [Synergistes sp.]|nr:hypothetical protein [Synergistes sp.]
MTSVKVQKVERLGKDDVYNLEVEGTHCFAVEDGAIIHNCLDALRYYVHTLGLATKELNDDYVSVFG